MKKFKDIELGNRVKCSVTGVTGIVYTISEHFHGCWTVDVMPEGEECMTKVEQVSTVSLERIGDGITHLIGHQDLQPVLKFKLGQKVKSKNGVEGTVIVVTWQIAGRIIYVVQPPSKDGLTKEDAFVSVNQLLDAA